MKHKNFLLMLGVCLFPLTINAISVSLKQKYPNTVLTDDYGILNEIDLNSHLDGVKRPPVFLKKSSAYIYWQCFARDSVRVRLEDLGFSPEEDDESDIKYNGENEAALTISVLGKNHIVQKYTMWGRLPITLAESRFNEYLKLMKGEPYVCLAGSYMENQSQTPQRKKQQIDEWAFIKIKTSKGCIIYRNGRYHYAYVDT